jgi:hypothetical protein
MRDQYAGDVSDVLKFAFLRALAGTDRTLGIAWYYAPGDDGREDGRHLEWRDEPAWRMVDAELHAGLAALSERSVVALEKAAIWSGRTLFHHESVPSRPARAAWQRACERLSRTLPSSFSIPTTASAMKQQSTRRSSKSASFGSQDARLPSSLFRAEACRMIASSGTCMSGCASRRGPKAWSRYEPTFRFHVPQDRARMYSVNAGLPSSILTPS